MALEILYDGSVADQSGNGRDAVMVGNVELVPDGELGDNVFHFFGGVIKTDWIDLGGNASFGLWVKEGTPSAPNGSWSINNQANSSHYTWSNGTIYEWAFRSSRYTVGVPPFNTGQWNLYVVTNGDANGWRVYQNGVVIAQTAKSSYNPTSYFRVGNGGLADLQTGITAYDFGGYCCDIRFYSEELPQEFLQSWYNGGRGYTPSLSTGLQGWWCPSRDTAGNGTTTLTDLSGNGNNGTLTNMDAATDWVADTDNGGVRALDFDGVSQSVQMANAALPLTGDFTLSVWFLYRDNEIGAVVSQYTLGVAGRTSININQNAIGFQQSNALNFYSNPGLTASTTGLATNTWFNIVLQRSSNKGFAYVNGTLVATDSDWSTAIEDTAFALGVSVNYLNGRIDATAVWDRALTSDEITQIYNDGRSLNLLGGGTIQSIVPQLNTNNLSIGYDPLNGNFIL